MATSELLWWLVKTVLPLLIKVLQALLSRLSAGEALATLGARIAGVERRSCPVA